MSTPTEAIANIQQIRGMVRDGNIMRKALNDIHDRAVAGMGEWACVQPPYLPANMEALHDIVEFCDDALLQISE